MIFPDYFGRQLSLSGALCFRDAWHWQDSLSAACGLVFAKDIAEPRWRTTFWTSASGSKQLPGNIKKPDLVLEF